MKKLIITEGKDDKLFFEGLLGYLKTIGILIDAEVKAADKHGKGGKSQVLNSGEIKLLITSESEEKKSQVLIICDADFVENNGCYDGFKKSEAKTKKILEELQEDEISHNKKIDFFIIPNNRDDGNLETLYLSCLKTDKRVLNCVDSYFECLSLKDLSLPKNSKIRARSILTAIGHKDDIYAAGFAAYDEKKKSYRQDYWDFNSPALKPLINFIKQFFQN